MSDSTEHNWPLETFHYQPKKDYAIAVAAAYGIILNILAFRLWRRKSKWAWMAPAAPAQMALGYGLRYYSAKDKQDVLALSVISQGLIVGFVGGYTIFFYRVYLRILDLFATGRDRYSIVNPRLAFWVLTICDLVTFSGQAAGAALRATVEHQSAGRVIFLIAVIPQCITLSAFIVMLVFTHRIFRNDAKFDRYNFPWLLIWLLYFSSLCIMVRSIYRVAETAGGNNGELFTHEAYLYILDAIPVALSISIYMVFWPDSLIAKASSQAGTSPEIAMNQNGQYNA